MKEWRFWAEWRTEEETWANTRIIQSNYAAAGRPRDPRRLEEYLEFSNFLPDVNLESPW